MKGVIFTEFLEMVDDVFSPQITEDIIASVQLPSGGAYTSVGTYAHAELLALVAALSKAVDIPAVVLVETFGAHLFGRFSELYPSYFEDRCDVFSFLQSVEEKIHTEVRKLHTDVNPPRITCIRLAENLLRVDYKSHRCLSAACYGLLQGCVRHFNEPVTVTKTHSSSDGACVSFLLERVS